MDKSKIAMAEAQKDKNLDFKERLIEGQDATHALSKWSEPSNKTMKAVVYSGKKKVALKDVPYPRLANHGVIIKIVAANICGSDLHMFRGSMQTPKDLVFGHENTGIVEELGSDVLFVKKGDLVSIPFNVACGRCENCKLSLTNACLNTNQLMPGAIYGYCGMGDWAGGQAEYLHVPFADFNCLVFADQRAAMDKICDLAMLSDSFCTSYHGAVAAKVGPGDIVYVAGAGPIGLGCAKACQLLGAAMVIVGDTNPDRLPLAASMGCKTVDLSSKTPIEDQLREICGKGEVDKSVDCVGFEAHGTGSDSDKIVCQAVLDTIFKITKAGGCIGIPGAYFIPEMLSDPKMGKWQVAFTSAWCKGHSLAEMGQVPVARYNRHLAKCIMTGKLSDLAKQLNVTLIDLKDAQAAYDEFDKGAPKKFVFDPHHIIRDHLKNGTSIGGQGVATNAKM
jgi:glutathione-independent formaldehyde dehydrogenase